MSIIPTGILPLLPLSHTDVHAVDLEHMRTRSRARWSPDRHSVVVVAVKAIPFKTTTIMYRNAINDPHQCRLCLRVCEDSFLESIFSEKEYSIAHQIFECTSIRVTKQDNLTKICKNCASLLFITIEFRNACFKTNRLLLEDFVILEVGEWTETANRSALHNCSQLIVKHKQQVDYLYASVVPDSESYLAGSLDIERELFNSVAEKEQKLSETDESRLVSAELEPEEPDPEIIQEITKFLEEQQSIDGDDLCRICGLDDAKLPLQQIGKRQQAICEMCRRMVSILYAWQSLARRSSRRGRAKPNILSKLQTIRETLKHLLKLLDELKVLLQKIEAVKPPKTSSKRKKVTCEHCGKQLASWKMKAHLNEHENRKPFQCDQPGCTSAFSGSDLLRRHRKLQHTDHFYRSCPTCGKQCKTQGIYKTHVSYHEEPKLPCEICGKLMRNQRAMWKHRKSHENPAERKHVCEVCSKRFAVAYTLRVHRRTHTKEKPFPCGRCEKQFQYNCLLKAHVQRYHAGEGRLKE